MSKFKVWCNGKVKVIKRVDEWENGEYGYYFNIDDELLDYYKEEDLELYKTPHERLLELGWKLIHEGENIITYGKYYSTILCFDKKHINCYTDVRNIDLKLAEILVDYLKELENE